MTPVKADISHPAPPQATRSRVSALLDRTFRFTERGSTLSRELLAGVTTFSTMSYVLVVNPLVLSATGMDRGALITATAVIAVLFTLAMGLRTNYPLAMAPGMGVNAYVAAQVCQAMHIPWQAALGMVFYSGLLFLILSLSGIRRLIMDAFPLSFKKTVGSGIGLFIAFLGLRNAGVVVPSPRSVAALGNLHAPTVLLALVGTVLTVCLVVRRTPGALVLSIAAATVAGLFLPGSTPGTHLTAAPQHLFSAPYSMAPVALKLDLAYPLHHALQCLPIILALLFTDLFSAMAVLFGVGARAGLMDTEGNLPNLRAALSVDAAAASGAALLGSTTAIIYLESAAGVEAGGRTGLVSVSTAACFLLALFVTPLIAVVPAAATSSALIMVGIFMMQGLAEVDLRDVLTASVALFTLLMMTLTSASDGLALGFILHVLAMSFTGQWRKIKPAAWVLLVLFALHYLAR